jgi:hypothetical protein
MLEKFQELFIGFKIPNDNWTTFDVKARRDQVETQTLSLISIVAHSMSRAIRYI